LFCFLWSAYNIPDSGVSEHSTTDMSNSDIGKYYITKKYDIPDSSASELTSKFEWKAKHTFFFINFLKEKKGTDMYRISDSHFTVKFTNQIYIEIIKKARETYK
jgi:hypothetical protein